MRIGDFASENVTETLILKGFLAVNNSVNKS